MNITKDEIEKHGFTLKKESGLQWYERKFAAGTSFRFGFQFNGALELVFPDGNDGEIILTPNAETWEDLDIMERLFKQTWIDTGHTLTANWEDPEEAAPAPNGGK